MKVPPEITKHLKKPVAIFGWGVSGRAVAPIVRRLGAHYEVFDQHHEEAKHDFTEQDAKRVGLVIYSPGFEENHPWLKRAQEAECLCLAEIDFAGALWRGALIAVTGTNGKTTLTEFLTQSLKAYGVNAVAAGNIGYPISKLIEHHNQHSTVAICEVSSAQARSLRYFSPVAVLWTSFAEDHLDSHGGIEHYFAAKWNLIHRMIRPCLIVGKGVAEAAKRYGRTLPVYTKIISREQGQELIPQDSVFSLYPQQENYLIVRAFWEQEGFHPDILEAQARTFRLPKHRLQKIGEHKGIRFWNDSKATNFESVLAALKTFPEPVYWIGGGKSKGGDMDAFVKALKPNTGKAFLIGEVSEILHKALEEEEVNAVVCQSLQDAVLTAVKEAQGACDVLLSPGFASFDMFENYAHRGTCFEEIVLGLKDGDNPDSI
tara:strand:+ start:54630 stop:55919 length:1290 start_codon:yes stop_codon:yes gene_type:complete